MHLHHAATARRGGGRLAWWSRGLGAALLAALALALLASTSLAWRALHCRPCNSEAVGSSSGADQPRAAGLKGRAPPPLERASASAEPVADLGTPQVRRLGGWHPGGMRTVRPAPPRPTTPPLQAPQSTTIPQLLHQNYFGGWVGARSCTHAHLNARMQHAHTRTARPHASPRLPWRLRPRSRAPTSGATGGGPARCAAAVLVAGCAAGRVARPKAHEQECCCCYERGAVCMCSLHCKNAHACIKTLGTKATAAGMHLPCRRTTPGGRCVWGAHSLRRVALEVLVLSARPTCVPLRPVRSTCSGTCPGQRPSCRSTTRGSCPCSGMITQGAGWGVLQPPD